MSSPLTATPDQIYIRDLQLLVLQVQAQTRRAKRVLDNVSAGVSSSRRISSIPSNRDASLPQVRIDLFDGYIESYE
jgi:hypothetical protein